MIVDNIKNIDYYKNLSEIIRTAFNYALKLNKNTPCGRIDICDGLFVNIMEYEGKEQNVVRGETHNNYIDIQYIIDGSERIGYAKRINLIADTEYDEKKDIQFWNGVFEFITLNEGDFLIAFPQDGHAPGFIANDKLIKKAVFKVKVDKL